MLYTLSFCEKTGWMCSTVVASAANDNCSEERNSSGVYHRVRSICIPGSVEGTAEFAFNDCKTDPSVTCFDFRAVAHRRNRLARLR
jgi:hypothetical protein